MRNETFSKALRTVLALALGSWAAGSSLALAGQRALNTEHVNGLAATASQQANEKPADRESSSASSSMRKIAPGVKQKITGVITSHNNSRLVVMDSIGGQVAVDLLSSTKIEEKKGNPFRGAHRYSANQLLRGLNVEVEGKGGGSGALEAEKIRFTKDDLMVAQTVESRVSPVEGRLGTAEVRLTETEQNAERLSGQMDELAAISNAARGGAKAAQETADAALDGVDATNERIAALDDYQTMRQVSVNFRAGSAGLSDVAKAALDEVAEQAKSEKGYLIQVTGFASSEGSESFNTRLSQRRADAVIQYLVMTHDISLRRIITPFGYGETHPVAENNTRQGRQENRRVEVSVLVNRGITTPTNVRRPGSEKGVSSSGAAAELQAGGMNRNH